MNEYLFLAAGLAVAAILAVVMVMRRRAGAPANAWRQSGRPGQSVGQVGRSVGSASSADAPRPEEAEALLERLGACLEWLYAEPDPDDGESARLFMAKAPALPPEVEKAVRRVSGDAAAGQLIARLSDPGTSLAVVAETIAANPLLAGNVLKIANSPLFGLRAAIADVGQAIGVIGLGNVRALVFADLLESAAAKDGLDEAARLALWTHLAKTAVVARRIAPAFAGLDPAVAYTAGLLHDIGMLALPAGQPEVDAWAPATEAAVFGLHHGAAGAAVCAGFALPPQLSQAVLLHHAPAFAALEDLPAAAADIRLALAVGMADALALVLDGRDPATIPPLRHSYRFLVNEPVLADVLADPALLGELSRTMAVLAASRA